VRLKITVRLEVIFGLTLVSTLQQRLVVVILDIHNLETSVKRLLVDLQHVEQKQMVQKHVILDVLELQN
jgi:hypothetical protein